MGEHFREWHSMGVDFREALTFRDFCKLKQNEKGKGYGMQNYELHRPIGKMYFPTYDGTSKCIAHAWVEKLDTYFQMNRMTEVEAIKMATLHLEA